MIELENKIHLELQSSITTAVENSVQLFSSSIAFMVENSFKQKMEAQIQPSLDWIKAHITTAWQCSSTKQYRQYNNQKKKIQK
eukprot:4808324-Ditylum_brightwellii.AAC.1